VSSDLSPDFFTQSLAELDPEVADAIAKELHRQQATLEMIASENFVPQAILEAQGSVLTNKYAEGYPGKRYYGGCEYIDVIEQLAIEALVLTAQAEDGLDDLEDGLFRFGRVVAAQPELRAALASTSVINLFLRLCSPTWRTLSL